MAQNRLTTRELEVLELLASGYSNMSIAETLSISEYSVKKHVSAIIQKLYVRNRAHAAAVAVHQGLIRPTINDQPESSQAVFLGSNREEPWETLTVRELEIFMMLGDRPAIELTNEALAETLNITRNTLRKHLRSIYKKLDARSRAGLVGLSMEARQERDSGGSRLEIGVKKSVSECCQEGRSHDGRLGFN